MKGDTKVKAKLQFLIGSEWTARFMYTEHASILRNMGYAKLADKFMEFAGYEGEHIDELSKRLTFLDGVPEPTKMPDAKIATTVRDIILFTLESELKAKRDYTDATELACEAKDFGSRALFEHILTEEEEHVLFDEQLLTQIEQMGEDNWLSLQV